jgi:hypothetical protein
LEIEREVDAPLGELFDLMADPEGEEQSNPDALEVRRVDQGPVAPGARWRGRYKGMGRMEITLSASDRLGLCSRSQVAGWTWTGRSTFAPTQTGTRLTAAAELRPPGALRLLSPLFGPMMRRTFSRRPAQLAAGVAMRHANSALDP